MTAGRHRYIVRDIVIEGRRVGTIAIEELEDVPGGRIVKLELHERIHMDSEAVKQLHVYVDVLRDMQKEWGRQALAEVRLDERTVSVGPVYTAFEEVSLIVALVMLVEAAFHYRYLL